MPMTDAPYHRANLRETLLREAAAELEEKGVEGFSLRGVAKRAGVSHAAPAHHFGDVGGLLTALAARGFALLLETQKAREDAAGAEDDRFVASGLGYVDFALANPALFRLMFASKRVEKSDADYQTNAGATFAHLAGFAGKQAGGADPMEDEEAQIALLGAWAIVHGLADLMVNERPKLLMEMDEPARERIAAKVIARTVRPRRSQP